MGFCLCLGGDVLSVGRGLEPCKGWLVNKVGRPPAVDGTACLLENKKDLCAIAGGGVVCSTGPRALRALGHLSSPIPYSGQPGATGCSSPPSGSEAELPPTFCTFYLESGCSKGEDCVWFNANLAFTSRG